MRQKKRPASREYRELAENWYMAAHEALWRNSAAEHEAGIDYETPEFLTLNHEANLAAAWVPWWRQFFLDIRVKCRMTKEIATGRFPRTR